MGARPKHRGAIVAAAAGLFRRRGYAATGINEIVAASGAPKGSLYHYFPGGKDEIAEAALDFAGARVTASMEELSRRATSAAALVRAYGGLLEGWMAQSGWRDGCPLATTVLETAPELPGLTRAGREAFEAWRAVIERALARDGVARFRARRLSALVVAALEGALIVSRADGDGRIIADVTAALAQTLAAAARRPQ
ncbi:TetR/AcrR family transcriptional regulator [Bradyrhizobium sp. WD16]|uniref:TetR/AcrR family transcriptional regulator n=1 Tax=Bradyrhizobium sp. WD16 TaxID=1521768 RepID=UPI0020A3ACC2|nr:TetR/AcrR family transcriptional regulator [Bradyrhizobium sp. WD16]UTD26397.1 TetR/AcrR family transcriptional regulator [Bradyrhizobium sp. WD16]